MECLPRNNAARRYRRRFLWMMAAYVPLLLADVWVFKRDRPAGVFAYVLALLPALPLVGAIITAGLYLAEEKDEFVRNLMIQSMVWGIGATLTFTTVWGFLEDFVAIPHFETYLVFPLFCFLAGVSRSILRLRYR